MQYLILWVVSLASLLGPHMQFEKQAHSFGQVKEGKIVNFAFDFTNTGNAPLLIQEVAGSCGCTTVAYPSYPIKPNEKDRLVVKFITKGKSGKQNLEVRIKSNASTKDIVLHIQGEVLSR